VVIGNQEWLILTEIDKMLRRILEDPLSATGGGGGRGVRGWMALWALENEIEKILRRILPSKQNDAFNSTQF
jgi:hypothetical protein